MRRHNHEPSFQILVPETGNDRGREEAKAGKRDGNSKVDLCLSSLREGVDHVRV